MKTLGQWLLIMLTVLFVDASNVIAGGGPENVLVVVNADSISSKTIANHYIRLRKIPATNVVYLNNIPDENTVNWGSFSKANHQANSPFYRNTRIDGHH